MYVNALYQNSWHITLAWRLSLLRLLLPWWINTIIKASQGEKGLFASLSLLILKEVRTGTQTGHEFKPGGRSWCRGHGEVLLTGLLSLLSIAPRTTSPEVALSITCWANSHPSLIKKVPHRLAYSQSYGGIFSIEGSLPDNSSMFKVDKKPKQHSLSLQKRPQSLQLGFCLMFLSFLSYSIIIS